MATDIEIRCWSGSWYSDSCNVERTSPWQYCNGGDASCDYTITPSPTTLNTDYTFKCDESYECYGNTLDCPSSINCSIQCTGYRSCRYTVINCPYNGNCNIKCLGEDACLDATLNGPYNHDMNIVCDGRSACQNMITHGENANYFNFTMPTNEALYTAYDTTFYFPPKDDTSGTRRAYVYAGDTSFSGDQSFYALNGWLDVEIIFPGADYTYHGGTMYCNINYTWSCPFDADSWSCTTTSSGADDCDTPILINTPSPIITPLPTTDTQSPTIFTASPTVITSNPSTLPTLQPTAIPSENIGESTTDPSTEPTNQPTSSNEPLSSISLCFYFFVMFIF